MRRLLSMVLLLVLGLPLFASVLGRKQESRLPACCRRGGAHHCMEMAATPANQPSLRMNCPAFPRSATTLQAGSWSLHLAPAAARADVTRPEVIGQVEAGYRVALGRGWQKRGPPFRNS